jgi:pyruvate ferredoxin oxidoreductase gamma subunit
MVEVRWHGRGGQGAKTAAQLLALAQMGAGLSVQAFPEYGPERSGAPMLAYNRADSRRIRRHDGVEHPDYAVVLDASLWAETDPTRGLGPEGLLVVNSEETPDSLARRTGFTGRIWSVPANALAQAAGSAYVNVVLVGVVARVVGDVPEAALMDAVVELLGPRLDQSRLQAALAATQAGYRWAEKARVA